MTKIQFKCLCGHDEKTHNFDPDSAFFGCMYTITIVGYNLDGDITPHEEACHCSEFRPDTLKYVEEAYERRAKR